MYTSGKTRIIHVCMVGHRSDAGESPREGAGCPARGYGGTL